MKTALQATKSSAAGTSRWEEGGPVGGPGISGTTGAAGVGPAGMSGPGALCGGMSSPGGTLWDKGLSRG